MTANRVLYDAPVPNTGPVPAFKVLEWNEPVTKNSSRFDEKTRTIVREQVIIEKGFMVIFPRGHSNFYESLEALESAGLGEQVPLINYGGESEANKDVPVPATRRVIEKRV